MSTHRNRQPVLRALFAAVLATTATFTASSFAASDEGGVTFDYPQDPAAAVVTYTERIGGIGNPGGPSVTIYADGRAVVHYPDWATRAGEYELRLTPSEMDGLLRALVEGGVVTFDANATRREKRDAAERRAAIGRVIVTDDSTTLLDVHLERTSTNGAGMRSVAAIDKTISWYGVRTDAQQHPDIAAIQGLADVEGRLRPLLTRPDAVKIK